MPAPSITVCDPIVSGFEHVPANSSLLTTIRYAYPESAIAFHGDAAHLDLVRNQVDVAIRESISWVVIKNPERQASFRRRFVTDFRRMLLLLKSTAHEPESAILFLTFGNASVMWSLKLLLAARFGRSKVQIVLHGDFATLRFRTSMKLVVNPLYQLSCFKTAVRFGTTGRIQYVVLEAAVRDAVVSKYPRLAGRFKVLEHPVPGDDATIVENDLSRPLRFGFLGRSTEAKGFHRYLDVATTIGERFPGQAVFSFVGFLGPGQNEETLPGLNALEYRPTTEKLDRAEYVRRVNELHYICMFYEKQYELTASGVLLDAIEREKPLITSNLPLFKNIADRFPDFAHVCDADVYVATIATILTNFDRDDYTKRVEAIRAVKQSRSPQVLAGVYRNLVAELRGS